MGRMVKLLINVPRVMKQQLDGLRVEGYTASGYIRRVVAADMAKRTRKGRRAT